jgi:hypothetical protein
VRLGEFFGERARARDHLLPPRSTPFSADLDPTDQVHLAENANQVARFVDNGKSTDVVFRQELDRIGEIGIGMNGHDIADHDIYRTHVAWLRTG